MSDTSHLTTSFSQGDAFYMAVIPMWIVTFTVPAKRGEGEAHQTTLRVSDPDLEAVLSAIRFSGCESFNVVKGQFS